MFKIIYAGLCASLLFLVGCGNAIGKVSIEPIANPLPKESKIQVVVASDIHYFSNELTDHGALFKNTIDKSDGKQMHYITELTDAFLEQIVKQKPTALILSGDLTFNGEKISHKELAGKLKIVEKAGVPVLVIPGNHDINSPYAISYKGENHFKADNITPTEFAQIYNQFGFSDALYKDTNSLSYVAKLSEDTWVFMIDASKYELDDWASGGVIKEETLIWIEKCLTAAKEEGVRSISVTHQNLIDHNPIMNKTFTIENGDRLAKLLAKFNVQLNFSGHIHMQNIAKTTDTQPPVFDVASGALSVYPHQYGVLDITQKSLDYKVQPVNVKNWAVAHGKTDTNLLAFDEYSRQFFKTLVENNAKYSLMSSQIFDADDETEYTDANIAQMVQFSTELNMNYFAGTTNSVQQKLLKSDGYKLWEASAKGTRFKEYIDSILLYPVLDSTNLQIK